MKINIVGISGGLGNQMFQYAFYLSLKHKTFPKDFNSIYIAPYKKHNGYELDNIFKIKHNLILNLTIGFIKRYLHTFVFINSESKNPDLKDDWRVSQKTIVYHSGYWQNANYFTNIEEKIKSSFTFNTNKITAKNRILLQEIKNKNSISIHVRRGDYEDDPGIKTVHGGICSLEYYQRSVEYIMKNTDDTFFYIFSDDSEWIKQNFFLFPNSQIVDWNKKKDSWQDLMLMSQCKHNIIANSSFSWWGAWLNNNPEKIVIAPVKWSNSLYATDIVPDNWIRI